MGVVTLGSIKVNTYGIPAVFGELNHISTHTYKCIHHVYRLNFWNARFTPLSNVARYRFWRDRVPTLVVDFDSFIIPWKEVVSLPVELLDVFPVVYFALGLWSNGEIRWCSEFIQISIFKGWKFPDWVFKGHKCIHLVRFLNLEVDLVLDISVNGKRLYFLWLELWSWFILPRLLAVTFNFSLVRRLIWPELFFAHYFSLI